MRLKYNQLWSVFLTIFAISLVFTAGFITGCGDEGDSDTNGNGDSMTDMVIGGDDMDKDEEPTDPDPDPDPPVVTVSYKDDIEPILNESCALGGCHVAGGAAGLDLTSYDSFKAGGHGGAVFVANDGENSRVVQLIQDGSMPIGGTPLNAEQVQLFIDWIDEGAENN